MTAPLGMEELELSAYDAVFNLVDDAVRSYGVHRAGVACIFAEALEKLRQDIAREERLREFDERASQEIRKDHKYVEHRTYTGPGCAVCGLPESSHA